MTRRSIYLFIGEVLGVIALLLLGVSVAVGVWFIVGLLRASGALP